MATRPLPTPSSWNGPERRRTTRYNMALDVGFGPMASARAPSEAQLERTVSVNISLTGICLYSDTLYPIGTTIFCTVTLPHQSHPLQLVSVVTWFQKIDQEAHGYKLGLEFREPTAEQTAILQTLFDHPPTTDVTRPGTLLLVDDDAELRLALKLRFQSAGFHVITAGDGLEALRKGREERPHVIILDLMLPHLNGYEVCRLLKFDQKFRHIPIILCTARCRQEDRALGLAAGADAYVTKPFSGEALITQVETLLEAHRA